MPQAREQRESQTAQQGRQWLGAMGRKRLITDSFQVVKRQQRDPDTKEGTLQPSECLAHGGAGPPEDGLIPQPGKAGALDGTAGSRDAGITRLQRWERAESLGLSPPVTVRETLLEHEGDARFMHCLCS
ncbi:DNA polymerase delta subunit 4 [Chelonia mydas]|uniref:DNA polymerase delta subunit 4 n=1 Tax=Chelonia mydas TaxID=8469 RepID=M7AUJ6_CHEMY|nr:DNA polymerase delta subunit 4 [Chelonia mydas]